MSEFKHQNADRLELLRSRVDEIDAVIVQHRRLHSFISWCKSTDAVSLTIQHTEDGETITAEPFTIYTDDQHTQGRCEFNLITTINKEGELYEDYGIATQVNSPLHSLADDDSSTIGVIDFRSNCDSFADWAMGLTNPSEP